MKKHLLFASAIIVGILASCSPAQIAKGTYNGSISAYGYPTTSGSGNLIVTEVSSNTVNVKITSSGNPDVTFDGINVTKIEVPGGTYLSFSGSNSLISVDGSYAEAGGVNSCSIDIDSTSSSAYITFSGSK